MKLRLTLSSLLALLFLMLNLTACENVVDNPITATDTHTVVSGVKSQTCISSFKSGTVAKLRHSGATVALDANGCFDFGSVSTVAARSASVEDTVVLENDSSLFSLTIPFSYLGDTIQMVQTDMAIRRANNGKYDSVIAIIYDSLHIRERKAAMRKAYTSKYTDWSLKFYSPVNGNDFHVHFEYHKGDSSWSSELVIAEVGSSFQSNDTDIVIGSVPMVDTSTTFSQYGKDTSFNVSAHSIYGIAKITIDGKATSSFSDTNWGMNTHTIKVTDRAGYTSTKKITSYKGFILNSSNSHYVDGNYRIDSTMYVFGDSSEINTVTGKFLIVSDTSYTIKNRYEAVPELTPVYDTIQTSYSRKVFWNGHSINNDGKFIMFYNDPLKMIMFQNVLNKNFIY